MREHRNVTNRSKILTSSEPKKKFFFLFEGISTEVIYFNEVIEQRDKIGINSLLELIPITRCYNEQNWSNPLIIVKLILKTIEENQNGAYSCQSVLAILSDIIAEASLPADKNKNNDALKAVFEDIYNEQGLNKDSKIANIDNFCSDVREKMRSNTSLSDFSEIIVSAKVLSGLTLSYSKGLDEICIIVDRDPKSFVEKQYNEVTKLCKENDFKLYVTNPMFELWLLFHLKKGSLLTSQEENDILKNIKIGNKRYIEVLLNKTMISELNSRYKKNSYSANLLLNNIDQAILNSKSFPSDLNTLKNSIGTNLANLFDDLRK